MQDHLLVHLVWSLITTYFEGKLTPYIKLGVAVIISIFPFLNSSSIISFCSLKSPAWWNTTPFSAASASLRQVVVGSDPFFLELQVIYQLPV